MKLDFTVLNRELGVQRRIDDNLGGVLTVGEVFVRIEVDPDVFQGHKHFYLSLLGILFR